jgi:CHASE1-domain containing sensor protein/two-component sensor histidine kinase
MMKLRSLVPAMLAMALALMSTMVAAMMVQREVTRVEQRQFQMEATSVKDAIAGSMRSYALVLSASAALFQTVGDVSDSQWGDFVESLQLGNAYPGYQGLGFAKVVHRDEVDELERRHRAAGDPNFHVRPKDGRDLYIPIVKLEPRDWRNQRALGFDMFSEAVRRAAMERARDTGLASLSGKVVLVQETGEDVQPGVLMYLPVYADGPLLSSVQARRERLRGFAYMAMRMDDLIRAVLQRRTPAALAAFDITLHDGAGALQEETRIFHSVPSAASGAHDLKFEMPLEVAGRTWTVSVAGNEPLAGVSDKSRPWIVLGAGLIISGLIGAIVGFQAVARANLAQSRQALAEEIVERKKAQEAADMANSELIHRVKNTLAVVSAIASQTSRYSANMQEFNVAFRERLSALGRVQDLVRPGATAEPDLMTLIQQLLEPYMENGKERLVIKGPALSVPKNDVVLFSLAFNELATNAIKYGAWSNATGRVLVDWHAPESGSEKRALEITWQEDGGPEVMPSVKEGFGTAVLKFAIERAMGGKMILNAGPRGMVYRMRIPYRG